MLARTLVPLLSLAIAPALGLTLASVAGAAEEGEAVHADPRLPSTVSVKLSSLPRGPHARLPYLVGRDLHLANGTLRTLPFTKAQARDLVLAGRTAKGWVVGADPSPGYDFVLVKGQRKKFIHRPDADDGTADWRLNRGRTRLLVAYSDRGDASRFFVHQLDGRRAARVQLNVQIQPLEFANGRMIFSQATRTRRWRANVGFTTLVTQPSALADAPHDLLFTADPQGGGYGPTPLSVPSAPDWSASFLPVDVSPDGTRVAGHQLRSGAPTRRIDVRRVSDGKRLASFDPGVSTTLRWEDDKHLVWTDYLSGRSSRHALVRCSLAGDCERITALVKRNAFHFPRP